MKKPVLNIGLGTNNENKVKEYKRIIENNNLLEDYEINYIPLGKIDCAEDGTLEENARTKAEKYLEKADMDRVKIDLIISEDMGIIIEGYEHLTNEGAYTKRLLPNSDDSDRNKFLAKFFEGYNIAYKSVIAIGVVDDDWFEVETHNGYTTGTIVSPRGDNGFAYDKIMLVGDKTIAEMENKEKDLHSSRAGALVKAIESVKEEIDEVVLDNTCPHCKERLN